MNRESERKRLVELIGSKVCEDYSPNCDEYEPHSCEKCYANNCKIGELADHLLDNGIVVPPCKVGDKVYKVLCTNIGAFCGVTDSNCDECPYQNKQVAEGIVLAIKFVNGIQLKVRFELFTDYFCEDELYFTREEAEKMLKGEGE